MDNPKQQLIEKLKSSNNILVTVSTNPSVDQLAACIGLTLLLNKLGKHAAAVFSGEIPSTIEFLKPEDTLEKNTDSLRDFIIALDKSKADKLRYKVEDRTVKIFITPYKTSISEQDLNFSQGDFNVDVVVALGAHEQRELDQAITAHGRILHDAVVMSINNTPNGSLGTINWQETAASSLSEMVAGLGRELDKDGFDAQTATALLTGIVAETERFSNAKTSPNTMSISAQLMSAGANQQLVVAKLGEAASTPTPVPDSPAEPEPAAADRAEADTLQIAHHDPAAPGDQPESASDLPESSLPPIQPLEETAPASDTPQADSSTYREAMTEPPSMGGTLTANAQAEEFEPPVDPLSLPSDDRLILSRHDSPKLGDNQPPVADRVERPLDAVRLPVPPAIGNNPPAAGTYFADQELAPAAGNSGAGEGGQTLSDIERSVNSSHAAVPSVDSARDEVLKALNDSPTPSVEPIAALNAQPLGAELHPGQPGNGPVRPPSYQVHIDEHGQLSPLGAINGAAGGTAELPPSPDSPADQPLDMPMPPTVNPPSNGPDSNSPGAPPPVPPPMMPPGFPGSGQGH